MSFRDWVSHKRPALGSPWSKRTNAVLVNRETYFECVAPCSPRWMLQFQNLGGLSFWGPRLDALPGCQIRVRDAVVPAQDVFVQEYPNVSHAQRGCGKI